MARFMEGLLKRVGDIAKRDEPISIHVMLAIQELLEEQWQEQLRGNASPEEMRRITRTCSWFLNGFCCALRGEEMVLLEFAGTLYYLCRLNQPPFGLEKHFMNKVSGPTKGNRISGAQFLIPCVGTTSSRLQPGLWVRRYVLLMHRLGQTGGYLYSRDGAKAKLSDFHEDFYGTLETIQAGRPDLIPKEMDVRESYGILRSLRRGVTSHALNRGVERPLVDAVNRWRTERQAALKGTIPFLGSLCADYARLDQLTETLLRYSKAL